MTSLDLRDAFTREGDVFWGGDLRKKQGACLAHFLAPRTVIERARPERHEKSLDHLRQSLEGGSGNLWFTEGWLEETEGAFDMRLVFRAKGCRTHDDGRIDGIMHFGRMVAGLVIEEQGERRFLGALFSVIEGRNDSCRVFRRTDVCANNGARIRVYDEFKVSGIAFAIDDDRKLGAITDPLGVGKEGFEGLTRSELVRTAPRTS